MALIQWLQGQSKWKVSRHFDTIISRRLALQNRYTKSRLACLSAGYEDDRQYSAKNVASTKGNGFGNFISQSETESPEEINGDPISGCWERLGDLDMWKHTSFNYDGCKRYYTGRSVDVTQHMPVL
ncbi:hypothetical protein M408DRAFT_312009 [Serendipita vermifera MAFF 305830]|uniref:Uncharacterized protein n=1 Tax=Serendipita vermifera MAFF 305830 TaxID=933852 RepID=A0A0C3A555_SERVB|nr:hypothetical protein M408DRAFT_312009 [Serendipita vermifera MAFF 305830]